MAYRTDIQLNSENDIIVQNNDFIIDISDEQHIIDTIYANQGTWKEFPSHGVGIKNYTKGRGVENILARSIKIQLQNDDYNSNPIIKFDSTGKLTIDANVTIQ
jgi:hypothetical protein